jgi:hypothetical protein
MMGNYGHVSFGLIMAYICTAYRCAREDTGLVTGSKRAELRTL